MNDLELFQQFSKSTKAGKRIKGNNCVVYTRVSTKKQEDGYSLEIQLDATHQYAQKHNLNIVGHFGGKYESAQSDLERKEFNRMLKFAKQSKEQVSYVLVYTVDRFSRTGINGAYIKETLRQEGIDLVAVSQPTDTSNPGGRLQQNIQFIFSEYDNDLRREKCVAGMREKLSKGQWVGHAPMGYDMVTRNRQQTITINETGKLLQLAFKWKSQGMGNEQIRTLLKIRGLTMWAQKLHYIFSNPFYCGLVVHNLLEGKVVDGAHPPIVSKEVFLRINSVQPRNGKHREDFGATPLKRFIKCGTCGTPFTGYEVKKKRLNYYKCNHIGCKCNRNADVMHDKFKELLSIYQVEVELLPLLTKQLEYLFEKMNEGNIQSNLQMKRQLNDVNAKLDKLEEKFIFGDIDQELYEKFNSRLKQEKTEILQKMSDTDFELSNPKKYIDFALGLSSNLTSIWDSGSFKLKCEMQNMLFPAGIVYDREKDHYRTEKVHLMFQSIADFSRLSGGVNGERPPGSGSLSHLVARPGLEPGLF